MNSSLKLKRLRWRCFGMRFANAYHRRVLGLSMLCVFIDASAVRADDARTGDAIYRRLCGSCHGQDGQGSTEHYPQPLIGERSRAELIQFDDETMREENAKHCAGGPLSNLA